MSILEGTGQPGASSLARLARRPTAMATGGLAKSGTNSLPTATLGLGLLIAGLALLIPWRRFRQATGG
jgi:hypothetical protein